MQQCKATRDVTVILCSDGYFSGGDQYIGFRIKLPQVCVKIIIVDCWSCFTSSRRCVQPERSSTIQPEHRPSSQSSGETRLSLPASFRFCAAFSSMSLRRTQLYRAALLRTTGWRHWSTRLVPYTDGLCSWSSWASLFWILHYTRFDGPLPGSHLWLGSQRVSPCFCNINNCKSLFASDSISTEI